MAQSAPTPKDTAPKSVWGQLLRRNWVICLLLAVVTALVYVRVAEAEFVDYDDGDYVTGNLHVQRGLTWANVAWAFTTGQASNWHPLTWLTHMLDWQLFGDNAGPPHLVNLCFHIANTLLLFLLLKRSTGAHWPSAFVAGLFALHPVHVESVAWVSERKDVLSTLFFLLTLLAYVEYASKARPPAQSGPSTVSANPVNRSETRPRKRAKQSKSAAGAGVGSVDAYVASSPEPARAARFYGASLALFALGLMSKPMLVTMPFVLLLLDVWPLGRLRLTPVFSSKAPLPRLLVEKVPFLLLSGISSYITVVVQRRGGAVSTALPFGGRLANAAISYVRYVEKIFCPAKLSVLYLHPGYWPAWKVTGASVLLLSFCIAVFWLGRSRRYLWIGWLWFLGTLVPVIGLVQVGVQSMADRYTYIPAIGVFIMVTWAAAELWRHWALRPLILACAAGAALLACAMLSVRQAGFWHDTLTLFDHAATVDPRNYLAYNNIGYYYSRKGKAAEALENYRRSLEINPHYADALNNMGYAMAGQKKSAEAIGYYEAALAEQPNQLDVRNNLGNALADIGKLDEAIDQYRFVLARNPEHADAHNNLGVALAMQGKLDEAIEQFREALRLKPKSISAHGHLGNALAMEHKFTEAIAQYQICLTNNPQDAQAHNNIGNALTEAGRYEEAIHHYNEALNLNTNNPEAHFNLGMALLRQGKREEAISHFRAALTLRPDYADAQQQLSRVQANP